MTPAFLAHPLPSISTPASRLAAPRITALPSRAHRQHPPPLAMAALSRPVCRHARLDLDDDPPAREIPSVPEIAAVSATICDFMNKERLRDLALYIVRFGSKFDDLSQLTDVRMTTVDALGFTADVMACDESDCVCVQERLDWPLGLCHNATDVINALRHLSAACGLPTDF